MAHNSMLAVIMEGLQGGELVRLIELRDDQLLFDQASNAISDWANPGDYLVRTNMFEWEQRDECGFDTGMAVILVPPSSRDKFITMALMHGAELVNVV